jgi:glycosyltransferase involved in cell wall biosynthesis
MTTTNSRLRVAHLTLGLNVGGQERLLVEMARHRNADRFDWTVVVLGDRGSLADIVEAASVRVLPLGAPSGFRPSLWRQLARLFREERFDVVHTHDDRPLIYGAPAAWWAGVRCRIHTHHHGRIPPISRRQRWLIRFASRFAQPFVCVSHDSASYMIEQGVSAARVQTLWNGIDLTRFAYQGPCADGSVVTVARLSPEKDVANLLQTIPYVTRRFPSVRFEIAGDGPCRQKLFKLASELQITNHVTFHGEVRDGGNPEVVEPGVTGSLVPAGDPPALAQAICEVMADPERGRQMGLAGRQRVENCFDIRKMMTRYEAMYEMRGIV